MIPMQPVPPVLWRIIGIINIITCRFLQDSHTDECTLLIHPQKMLVVNSKAYGYDYTQVKSGPRNLLCS